MCQKLRARMARPPGSAKFANAPPPGLTRQANAPQWPGGGGGGWRVAGHRYGTD